MKILYLLRHGETLFNLQHKIQGHCDSPLTELGRYQARCAGQYFKENNIKFDYACCSTSERASDTLELVYDGPYDRLKGLKEWNFGAFEGKDECLNPKLPYRNFFVAYGGEDEFELRKRVAQCLTTVMENVKGDTVLAVSHGAAIAQFWREYEDNSPVKRKEKLHNGSILRFEYENKQFYLREIINRDIKEIG